MNNNNKRNDFLSPFEGSRRNYNSRYPDNLNDAFFPNSLVNIGGHSGMSSFPSGLMRNHNSLFGHTNSIMSTFSNFMDPFADFDSSHFREDSGFPGGSHYSSVTVMSSTTGKNGKPIVEKYSKVSKRDSSKKIKEVKEMYSSSKHGIDKISLKRELDDRQRHVTHKINHITGEEITNDEVIGMDATDEHLNQFNDDWMNASSCIKNPLYRFSNRPSFNGTENSRRINQLPTSNPEFKNIEKNKKKKKSPEFR